MARISAKNIMQKYIGTKALLATLMTLGDYNIHRGWNIPADEDPAKEGYLVQYEDGYISWSPKEIFEESYITENGYAITSRSSQAHEQRVIDEATDLFGKTAKLHDFISENPLFKTLPFKEQDRMKLQLVTMKCYYSVLVERINNFSGLISEEFVETNTPRELTFGQKLVGLNFNPSGDDRVGQAKQKFADVADMIGDPAADRERRSWSFNAFRTYALTTLLGAQMAAVKLLTWKD